MTEADTSFDGVSAKWREYEDTVRGAVRYELTRENLAPFVVDTPKQKILDLGGGTGPDSAWLARLGHKVIMVEPSSENRDLAEERFSTELTEQERKRIKIVPGDISALGRWHQGTFDLVLAHVVAPYLEDPKNFWQQALAQLRIGGMFSDLENSHQTVHDELILEQKHAQLQEFEESGWYTNRMDRRVQAFKPGYVQETFRSLGARMIRTAGIRFDSDSITAMRSQFGEEDFQRVLVEERTYMHDPERWYRCQLLHFIARKR